MDKSGKLRLRRAYKAKSAEEAMKKALAEKQRDDLAWSLLREHLSTATQRERHVYAARSNFDCNQHGIEFIVESPTLAEATAVLIFWKLGADYFARLTAEEVPDFQQPTDRLVWMIERRVRDHFYDAGQIRFDPMDSCTPPGEYVGIGPIKRPISEAMYRSRSGAGDDSVEYERFEEGIPIALAESLTALYAKGVA